MSTSEMTSPEHKGQLAGSLSKTKGLTLRLQDSAERTKLEERIKDPKTSIEELEHIQKSIWDYFLDDSLPILLEDIKYNNRSLLHVTAAVGAQTLMAAFSIWMGALFPIAIKDPEKQFDYNRDIRKLKDQERTELRTELAKIHALVTETLQRRDEFVGRAYSELQPEPKRSKHWRNP